MKLCKQSVFIVLAATMTCISAAQANQLGDIKSAVKRSLPSTKVDAVRKITEVPGLYEIRAGDNIFYSTKDGHYIMLGILVDTKTKKNLTALRMKEVKRERWTSLPKGLAIQLNPKENSRSAIFVDPDQYESKIVIRKAVEQHKGVDVYLLPQMLLSAESERLSDAIWCSEDRVKALIAVANDKSLKDVKGCKAPIKMLRDLSARIGVEGAPSLVQSDGSVGLINVQ